MKIIDFISTDHRGGLLYDNSSKENDLLDDLSHNTEEDDNEMKYCSERIYTINSQCDHDYTNQHSIYSRLHPIELNLYEKSYIIDGNHSISSTIVNLIEDM